MTQAEAEREALAVMHRGGTFEHAANITGLSAEACRALLENERAEVDRQIERLTARR